MADFSSCSDVIDSRDIIERISHLEYEQFETGVHVITNEDEQEVFRGTEEECEAWQPTVPAHYTIAAETTTLGELDDDELKALPEDHPLAYEAEELLSLRAFAEDASQYSSDWRYGETLINDSYFERYAEELANDLGSVKRDTPWPLNHIDWEAAADELKSDYASVYFEGEKFWIRSC